MYRDHVADDDGVRADQNLFDEQSRNLLSLDDVECLCAAAQLGAELGQSLRQPQVPRLVGGRGLE
jgi:hypothetical protein